MSARSLVYLIPLLALPFLVGSYEAWVLARVCLTAVAAFGLSLLFGHGGQLSLGQAGFMAAGAYVHVLLLRFGLSPFVSLPVAVLVALGLGLGLAELTRRVRGVYLALATFAFGMIVEGGLRHFDALTGGRAGLAVPVSWLSAGTRPGALLGCALVAAAVSAVLHRNLTESRVGRALRLIRDDEIAASAIGIDVQGSRRAVFALSAAMAGAAGALMTHLADSLHPGQFSLSASIELLLIVLIARRGTSLGVALASLFVVGSSHYLADFGAHQQLVFGALLLVAASTVVRPAMRPAP